MTVTTVAQHAGCYDCQWASEHQLHSRKYAARHAKKYKHHTWAEVTRTYSYSETSPDVHGEK